jgi:hypothetical protein
VAAGAEARGERRKGDIMKQTKWLSGLVLFAGVMYSLVAVALLIAPTWFFENMGTFPPFNRHYMGDLGSFLLPIAVGLIVASRQPQRHFLLIVVIAAGNILHALNHIYDAIIGRGDWVHWLSDTVPLIFFAVIFLWAIMIGEWKLETDSTISHSPVSNP